MSSFKQLIINAVIKVSAENPALNREDAPSADEARDMFIAALVAELFPEDSSVVTVPQTLPQRVAERKATKEEKAKAKEEAKAAKEAEKAEKAKAKEEAKAAKADAKAEKAKAKSTPAASPAVVAVVVEEAPVEEESPSGRKKRAPMTEEQKEAMKAKRAATIAAKKAAAGGSEEEVVVVTGPALVAVVSSVAEEKPKKVKKEKPAADANLPKIDPTWRKHLKKADKDHAKDLEPELLAYLNALSKEDFNAKSAEEHVAEFLASRVKPAEDGKVETDLEVVDFQGKEYYVNPETKRVYEGEGVYDAEVGWTNYKPVGYVGMAAFAEMTLDA